MIFDLTISVVLTLAILGFTVWLACAVYFANKKAKKEKQ